MRVIAVKTVGRVIEGVAGSLVGKWDQDKHPYQLRSWTPDDHRQAFSAGHYSSESERQRARGESRSNQPPEWLH